MYKVNNFSLIHYNSKVFIFHNVLIEMNTTFIFNISSASLYNYAVLHNFIFNINKPLTRSAADVLRSPIHACTMPSCCI